MELEGLIVTANQVNAINSINLIRSIEKHYPDIPVKEAIEHFANVRKYLVYNLDVPGKIESLKYEHLIDTRNWFSSDKFQTLLYGDLIGLVREKDPRTEIDYISGKEFILNREALEYIIGAAAIGIEGVIERLPSQMVRWNRTKRGEVLINLPNYFKVGLIHEPYLKKVFPEALNYHLGVFDSFAFLCGTNEFKTRIVEEESDYKKHHYVFEASYSKRGFFRRLKSNIINHDPVVKEMFSALEKATIDAAAQNRRTIDQNFEARRKLDYALKQLPPNVANEIIIDGKEPQIKSREVYRSTQFTDIRNFTEKTEGFEKIDEFLELYFSTVSPQIKKNNGQIDKYIGDSVMSRFNKASDAVGGAIDIMEKLKDLNEIARKNKILEGKKIFPVYTGIGIATGFVREGYFGDGSFMQFTNIGDSVTLASRLENLTKEYNVPILVDERTFFDLSDSGLLGEIDFSIELDMKSISSLLNFFSEQKERGLIFGRKIDSARPKGKKHIVGIYEIMNSYSSLILLSKLSFQREFSQALSMYQIRNESSPVLIRKSLEDSRRLFQEIDRKFQEKYDFLRELTKDKTPDYKNKKGEFICQQKIKIIDKILDKPSRIESWEGIPTFFHK